MILVSSVLVYDIQSIFDDEINFAFFRFVLERLVNLCHQNLTCGIEPYCRANDFLSIEPLVEVEVVVQLYHQKSIILCPPRKRHLNFPLLVASIGLN